MYYRLQLDDLLAPSEGDGVLAIFPVVGGDIIPDQVDFTVSPLRWLSNGSSPGFAQSEVGKDL